jgi:hypothetical protein
MERTMQARKYQSDPDFQGLTYGVTAGAPDPGEQVYQQADPGHQSLQND